MALATAAAHGRAEATYRPKANKLGLWLFFASETFLFAAFISSRYVLLGTEQPHELNQALALALTILLLVSSISAYTAEVAMASDDEVQPAKAYLNSLNDGEVQDFQVPTDSAQKLEDAKDVPPPDESDDASDDDASPDDASASDASADDAG